MGFNYTKNMRCPLITLPDDDELNCCPGTKPGYISKIFIPKNKQAMGYVRKKLRESDNLVDADWIQKMVDKGTLIVQTP